MDYESKAVLVPCHLVTGIPMPPEILLQVFNFLNIQSVCASACVSIAWNKISIDENLWKQFCHEICHSQNKIQSHSWRQATLNLMRFSRLEALKFEEYTDHLQYWKSMYNVTLNDDDLMFPELDDEFIDMTRPSKSKQMYKQIAGFKEHPDSSDNVQIQFSIDLLTAAKDTYCFIYSCKARQRGLWTHNVDYLKEAMKRYFKFLKLKSMNPNVLLVPTMDIEYVWLLHMSRPQVYTEDCMKYFGKVIDHKIRLARYETLVRSKALRDTAILWKNTYNEDFGVDIKNISDKVISHNLVTLSGKNISGTWIGIVEYPDKNSKTISFSIAIDDNGNITGNGKEGLSKVKICGSLKDGEINLTSYKNAKDKSIFNGNLSKECKVCGVVTSGKKQKGTFKLSKQIIPSGVWEGYVNWKSGTFNGQPLNAAAENMRVFLVFDNHGGIYGGGSQRNDYFEVKISGTYDNETKQVQWTKLTHQKSNGALNGFNQYYGKIDGYNIKGRITREGTNWQGAFNISYCFDSPSNRNDMNDYYVGNWCPPPPDITKLTTQMSYFEQLWNEEKGINNKPCNANDDFEMPELGITVEDIVKDSSWLDYYCLQVYNGLYYHPDIDHLNKSIKAYERMLFLIAKYPEIRTCLQPSYAIDLIWKTHVIHPSAYIKDCEKILTFPFNNKPKLEAPYLTLGDKYSLFKDLWKEEYEKPVYVANDD